MPGAIAPIPIPWHSNQLSTGTILSLITIYLTDWAIGFTVDMYSEDAHFETRHGHKLH
jgi:hypothetical protein